MIAPARTARIPELSQRILDMAKTGVYRESIFEALQPMATKKAIRLAIAHAKKFGLHSVASLRDETLGTYYQLDAEKYATRCHALEGDVPYDDDALMERAIATTQVLDRVLMMAQGISLALFVGGVSCWGMGQRDLCAAFLIGAASVAGTWAFQKHAAHQVQKR
jgi:hypothetical protein